MVSGHTDQHVVLLIYYDYQAQPRTTPSYLNFVEVVPDAIAPKKVSQSRRTGDVGLGRSKNTSKMFTSAYQSAHPKSAQGLTRQDPSKSKERPKSAGQTKERKPTSRHINRESRSPEVSNLRGSSSRPSSSGISSTPQDESMYVCIGFELLDFTPCIFCRFRQSPSVRKSPARIQTPPVQRQSSKATSDLQQAQPAAPTRSTAAHSTGPELLVKLICICESCPVVICSFSIAFFRAPAHAVTRVLTAPEVKARKCQPHDQKLMPGFTARARSSKSHRTSARHTSIRRTESTDWPAC